jgi:penicillin-insensitive murein endopeptidase
MTFRYLLSSFIGALLFLTLKSCLAPPIGPNDYSDGGCGNCDLEYYDSDGDCLSDATELNYTNSSRYGFDHTVCNENPSRAIGTPSNGSLEGGINLVDVGEGYLHYNGTDPVDYDDWGTMALCNCIEKVGRQWTNTAPLFNTGDMSRDGGGEWLSDHVSHQNGLDVDVRYVRHDKQEQPLDIFKNPEDYNNVATLLLMAIIVQNCNVTDIFCDPDSLKFTNEDLAQLAKVENRGWLKYAKGHTNHFHVRINQP